MHLWGLGLGFFGTIGFRTEAFETMRFWVYGSGFLDAQEFIGCRVWVFPG